MAVKQTDVPGRRGEEAWQCSYCGKMFAQRTEAGRGVERPRTCDRCGSPMDAEAARKYEDEHAVDTRLPQPSKTKDAA